MQPRLFAAALLLAASIHVFALVNETRAPAAPDTPLGSQASAPVMASLPAKSPGGRLPTAAPDNLMAAYVASTPFPTPPVASLPRREPDSAPPTTPTATQPPRSERSRCDPAYPDDRTCIPPGPPFAQGCAITAERLFTVLPPDPQRLDHDNDGIGCEPIRGG